MVPWFWRTKDVLLQLAASAGFGVSAQRLSADFVSHRFAPNTAAMKRPDAGVAGSQDSEELNTR